MFVTGYFLAGVDVGIVAPSHDLIAFHLEYTHHLDCGNLAAIRAYKTVQSRGKHAISVCRDQYVKMDCRDTRRSIRSLEKRDRFFNASGFRNAFVYPYCPWRKPPLDGKLTIIIGEISGESGDGFDGVGTLLSSILIRASSD
jgi:hypothetical protein